MKLTDILKNCQDNIIISDMFTKANQIINNSGYKNIVASISGGADSDIVLDVLEKIKHPDVNITYVWFNTGLEYQATKNHLDYLENKYNIKIRRERAIKPIPQACKEWGQPFLNKDVSFKIKTLQNNNFDFKDYTPEEFVTKYPNCKGLVNWWCNLGESRRFKIERNRFLKEFLIANPPTFRISPACCNYAKKKVSHRLIKELKCDLMIVGVRKAEGGIRAVQYKDCYTINRDGTSYYRPLFWLSDSDRLYYETKFNIKHSDCYCSYGFLRTGCVCCPYGGKSLSHELQITQQYEPNMYKAVTTVFKDSYAYTETYYKFVKDQKQRLKGRKRLF